MSKERVFEYIEQLKQELLKKFNKEKVEEIFDKYTNAFSEDYLLDYTVNEIIEDIEKIESLSETNQYAISLAKGKDFNIWQIKLLKYKDPVSLSRGLPIIENFGVKLFDEHPYKMNLQNGDTIHVCDFGVEVPSNLIDKLNDKELLNSFQDAIVEAFNRKIENDALNNLILYCGLNAHEITLLRAITHYLVQTSLPFSYQYLGECLRNYPSIAKNLFGLFKYRFDLSAHDEKIADKIRNDINKELLDVNNLNEDRILKSYLAVIDAMLRTNYYQRDLNNNIKSYISFKLESGKLSFLPLPKPLYEIFVYSRRFEAIHLRGGRVARGGLRWSDRREDFRTEVLGLVKAQIVKNSVIVPTGSKGGFVCKKLPNISDREAYMAEGIACYKSFIAGLLDITDNMVAEKIISPKDVICYDENDPYLVVAADKGTATFSDYANEMSKQYNFWLGDAFASGGSAGYDHKKMGITAKGAWESTKRHFRHLGIDCQSQDFTVIGIGDMAGDVFGNAMLLSKHIRLLAAFNHQHIFLDPNPDAFKSFVERQRLFKLPRSSWADYNVNEISAGGGVYERSLKTIPLSSEVKNWLQVNVDSMTPSELINSILKAKADLLYNGGIGTYIKSESESNEMVKDKANDLLRVNGNQLKVKVVVEGGNLGATQLGRVEFAKSGGNIYTDAIDNSAGVDCSDHEVNIKILFSSIMQHTKMNEEERNKILESMTDEVAALVLRDNYLQTEILRYASARSIELFNIQINFIDKLEKLGILDRKIEFLPNQQEIIERQRLGIGLTMPELSVLLAYSKINLDKEILNIDLSNEIYSELLINYFPSFLQQHYLEYIKNHYLHKQIISNQLANLIVNRMGITFMSRFEDEFNVGAAKIIESFWTVYKLIDAQNIFKQIEDLDNKVSADIQVIMLIRFKKALERMVRLVMREGHNFSLVEQYFQDMKQLFELLPTLRDSSKFIEVANMEKKFLDAGVPHNLAQIMGRSGDIPQLLNIIILAHETKRSLKTVAKHYFSIGEVLRFDWLRKNLIALPENNKWQALSRSALLTDGFRLYSNLVRRALLSTSATEENFIQVWMEKDKMRIQRIKQMFDELQGYKVIDLAMLSAILRELEKVIV